VPYGPLIEHLQLDPCVRGCLLSFDSLQYIFLFYATFKVHKVRVRLLRGMNENIRKDSSRSKIGQLVLRKR
jgi:hypothetical protein